MLRRIVAGVMLIVVLAGCDDGSQSVVAEHGSDTPLNVATYVTSGWNEQASKLYKVAIVTSSSRFKQATNGATFIFTMTVANEGSERDYYKLTAKSKLAWISMSSFPAELQLTAKASSQFTLSATIPLTTVMGMEDELYVSVRSTSHSTFDSTAFYARACSDGELQIGTPQYGEAYCLAKHPKVCTTIPRFGIIPHQRVVLAR